MASAEMSRTISLVNASAAYALGDVAASLTQANSIADAQEGLTNSLAQAEATFVVSSATAGTQEAKAISSAGAQLLIAQVQNAIGFLSVMSSAAVTWTSSIANATFAAATSGESTSQATLNAANAWRQFSLDEAAAEFSSAGSEMSALLSLVTSTIMAAKTESDTKADAAEARSAQRQRRKGQHQRRLRHRLVS